MEDHKNWRGVHVSQLQTSLNLPQYPRLTPGDEHTILIKVPVSLGSVPECYPSIFRKQDLWDSNHVKLPCSKKNVTGEQISRWNLIRDALNTRILTSQQLESVILSYNEQYTDEWNFSTLHSLLDEVLEETETAYFFDCLLPKIIHLALSLPELITGGIPLLKRGHKHSVSLSQSQISCLLANAFLCTFPHRNSMKKGSEYFNYPSINFNKLFQCRDKERIKCVQEKLKCLINYFRRVTNSVPTGVVTYSRQFVPQNILPEWSKSNKKLSRLFVSSCGTIEDDGFGLFQVDFANKFVGGGVIGTGCVQEEIRFVLCPELILSRLFTQCLGENEALVVTGCERFNKYKGYAQTFKWDGDYVDGTPSDEGGRKYCTVIALDAFNYGRNPYEQYLPHNILRDINKAYVGFSWGNRRKKEELCAIATGNWGCGAFKGNPELKSFLQLMAAAEVGRDLAYFTFGNEDLRNSMASIYQFVVDNEVTVGKLYNLLLEFNSKRLFRNTELFEFFRSKAAKETLSETDCDKARPSIRNTIGIPKLDITKRSFCSRTKINDWFGQLSKTDSPVRETEQSRIEDSAEKGLKLKETLELTNLYQSVNDVQQEEVRLCKDGFSFLEKFKRSLKKPAKQAVDQIKEVIDEKNSESNKNIRNLETFVAADIISDDNCREDSIADDDIRHGETESLEKVDSAATALVDSEKIRTVDKCVEPPRFAENVDLVKTFSEISTGEWNPQTSKSCGCCVVDDISSSQCRYSEKDIISISSKEHRVDNGSGNNGNGSEVLIQEDKKETKRISPATSTEKFLNLSALSREMKSLSSKKISVKRSMSTNDGLKRRKISDYFMSKDKVESHSLV